MPNVKPDTSLYSSLEMKIHALAKALNQSRSGLLEELDPFGGAWVPANGGTTDFMLRLTEGCEYRIKPKPREVWIAFDADGERLATFTNKSDGETAAKGWVGCTVERFVQAPNGP